MNKNCGVFVTGHRGLVGSALMREYERRGEQNLVTATRTACNLANQYEVNDFFAEVRPEYVIHCAAKVGGILFHQNNPLTALSENLAIAENVIHAAAENGVKKLLFLGSACAYPKHAENPIREDSLLTGPLEPSNEGYALAKIVGIKLCEAYRREKGLDFISCMPTNIYGPGDNYDPQNSHVLPGMMRKIHEANLRGDPTVRLWGTGMPTRELLHCDDLAKALIFLLGKYSDEETINIGTGLETPLFVLAHHVARTVGYEGTVNWDLTKPDGTPKRRLDSSKIFNMGWKPEISLVDGLKQTYDDFLQRYSTL